MSIKNKLFGLAVLGMFFLIMNVQAQIHNEGALYIGANATTYLKNGNFSFGTSAATSTQKTGAAIGVLTIGSGASIDTGTVSQFVDGWVNTKGTEPFIFPVGVFSSPKHYAPIQAIPVSGSTGVSATYFRADAHSISSFLDGTLTSISLNEYWKITGSNATVSLTWNSASAVQITLNELANITIAGLNTATGNWEAISSMVTVNSVLGGVSSVTSGSVTSSTSIALANYSAFSIGLKSLNCPSLTFAAGSAITYNGTSFSAPPELKNEVTINSSGSTGTFQCNSLVLNADITLIDGEYIEVVNGITGIGKIIMSSEASLVQRASGFSSPTIELTKSTRNTMQQFDYIYWGAPVVGNVYSQLSDARANTAAIADAFDNKYKYVSGLGGGWQNLTATETGKGFITRVRPQAPFATGLANYINLKFTGIANNGDITVDIFQNPSSPSGGTSHNLLANPYPSALDGDKFLQGNADIDGVIYIWKQQTASVGSVTPYNQADYIAYTRAGSTASSNVSSTPFLGKIASGQGFMVKALGTGLSVLFTNCMRLTGDNDQFNRVVNATPVIDRYKVNMIGDNGVFSQIVVSYLPQCTLGYDRMYDAGRNSVSTAQLFSILDSDGRKLAINARPDFADADVVQLGVSKTGTVSENFTLSIQEKEGVFAANTSVYVHDLLLNTYNDLTFSDYTFSSNTTLLNNRFELVYQNSTLNNPNFENVNATAFIADGILSVATSLEMKSIQVFDILGRKVITVSPNGLKTMSTLFPFSEGIYIVKITIENGGIVTKKLINKN